MPYKDPQKRREASRKYYKKNRKAVLARHKIQYEKDPRKFLDRVNKYRKGYTESDKEYAREYWRKQRRANPEKQLWKRAFTRARKLGMEFNIEISDLVIPKYCPVLGMELKHGSGKMHDNSPSLDRIDSTKGYIKGNVWIISWRANSIKKDATPEELRRLALALNQAEDYHNEEWW